MKKLTWFVVALVLLTATVWFGWSRLRAFAASALTQEKTHFTQGPPQVSIQKLNELVTLRVRVKTLLTGENNWYKGIWEIEGDALFGSDCGQAKWSSVDKENKTLILRLPEPRAIIARVDHERTRLYDLRCITWNPACLFLGNPDEMRDEAMKHAQEKLGKEASSEEHLSLAKQQAEERLKNFCSVVEWKLMVEWQ